MEPNVTFLLAFLESNETNWNIYVYLGLGSGWWREPVLGTVFYLSVWSVLFICRPDIISQICNKSNTY